MHTSGPILSRGVWAGLGGVAALVAVGVAAEGWTVEPDEIALLAGLCALLMGIAWVYTRLRPAPPIAAACEALAFLLVCTAALASLSYLAVALGLPLVDATFARLDLALGFDWTAHLEAVMDRPWLAKALTISYFSCQAQLVVVVLGLALADRKALGEFMTLYAITAAVVVVVSALLPAAGAYVHHAPDPRLLAGLPDQAAGRWHLRDFLALRDGSFQRLSLGGAEGLISFPSFHTVLGVLFARALLRLPYLGLPGLALNGVMILSTLSIGGHYLADVLAGGAIAIVAVLALNAAPARRQAIHLRTSSQSS